jgi:hypothetical protein
VEHEFFLFTRPTWDGADSQDFRASNATTIYGSREKAKTMTMIKVLPILSSVIASSRTGWFANTATSLVLGAFCLLLGCDGPRIAGKDLLAAIKANDIETIRKIGVQNPDFLNKPVRRKTPLEHAYTDKCKGAYLALLQYGADPDEFLADQQTMTFVAATDEDSYWLSKALEHGGSPDLMTKAKHTVRGTPLQAALQLRRDENARLLIDAKADLNLPIRPDPMNYRALDIAASKRNWDIAEYLLQKGADPHQCCESSVFMFRLKNPDTMEFNSPNYANVVSILKAQKLDITNSTWNGKTWDIPTIP